MLNLASDSSHAAPTALGSLLNVLQRVAPEVTPALSAFGLAAPESVCVSPDEVVQDFRRTFPAASALDVQQQSIRMGLTLKRDLETAILGGARTGDSPTLRSLRDEPTVHMAVEELTKTVLDKMVDALRAPRLMAICSPTVYGRVAEIVGGAAGSVASLGSEPQSVALIPTIFGAPDSIVFFDPTKGKVIAHSPMEASATEDPEMGQITMSASLHRQPDWAVGVLDLAA